MIRVRCEFEGCRLKAKFALYKLRPDFTKKWQHYCDKHDREVAQENKSLSTLYPNAVWKEGKASGSTDET